jgi:DNA-binding transcriptional ArsR family regulator
MAYEHMMDALGDPTRRAIFERLRRGPRAVGDIARGFPISRPAVSQHLRVLKEAGLVSDRREGTRRLYGIDLRGLAELRAYVDTMWTLALDDFKALAEDEPRSEDQRETGGREWKTQRHSPPSRRRSR